MSSSITSQHESVAAWPLTGERIWTESTYVEGRCGTFLQWTMSFDGLGSWEVMPVKLKMILVPLWSLEFLSWGSFHVLLWILAPSYLSSEVVLVGGRGAETVAPGLHILLTCLASCYRIVLSGSISLHFWVNSVAFLGFVSSSNPVWLTLTGDQEASEESHTTDFHPLCGKDLFLIVFFFFF